MAMAFGVSSRSTRTDAGASPLTDAAYSRVEAATRYYYLIHHDAGGADDNDMASD